MSNRIIATIHFNTDRYGSKRRTGAFDQAEFAKLIQDYDRSRMSSLRDPTPHYYVIYLLNSPTVGEELCLYFHEVENISQDEQGIDSK